MQCCALMAAMKRRRLVIREAADVAAGTIKNITDGNKIIKK
jgi:hypothetical protein